MKNQQIRFLFTITKKTVLLLVGYICFSFLLPNTAIAQYRFDEKASFININGTSTLHDWSASSELIEGSLDAKVENKYITKISSALIEVPVASLKSGKKLMDDNMHKALKQDQYPEISYKLKNYTVYNGKMKVIGELTIAGVSKSIETTVTADGADNRIKISGKVKVKMSDFNVKAPVLFMGAVKTGDEVSISFYFMFYENINSSSSK